MERAPISASRQEPAPPPVEALRETLLGLKRGLGAIRRRDATAPALRWLELAALDVEAQRIDVWKLPSEQRTEAEGLARQLETEAGEAKAALAAGERHALEEWVELFGVRARLEQEAAAMRARPELDGIEVTTSEAALAAHAVSVAALERLRADALPPFPRHWRAHALLHGVEPTRDEALSAMKDVSSRELPVARSAVTFPSNRTRIVVEVVAAAVAVVFCATFKAQVVLVPQLGAVVVALVAIIVGVNLLASRARRRERDSYESYEAALTDYMNLVRCVVAWDTAQRKRIQLEEQRQASLHELAAVLRRLEELAADPARGGRLASFEKLHPDLLGGVQALAAAISRA